MAGNLLLTAGIVIWGYVLKNVLKTKESFGPVLGIAVSMAVLEIGGAFGVLWPVVYFYCIAVCVFSIAYIAGTRDRADLKAYFLNPSIVGFMFAVLLYMIISYGKTLFYIKMDSFYHWGMFSKAVFYNHNFDIWNEQLSVNHEVYPHGMAAWYSLFVLGKKTYAERDVMLSINVLLFASSCPIVDIAVCRIRELFSDKKINALIAYPVAGVSVAGFLWFWRFSDTWAYTSGYMDIPLGAAFMAVLCLSVTDSADDYRKAFAVSLLSSMLVMIKQSGIIFVGVVCLVYLVNGYIVREFHMESRAFRKLLGGGGLVISVPLVELGIWNAMLKYRDMTGGDQFRLKDFLISNVIKKYQSDIEYAESFSGIIRNFFITFFTKEVTFHMSAFFWMILCIAPAAFTIIFLKERREKKKVLCVTVCALLLFFLYNLFLLWTYLTTMSKWEALGTVCYGRYIGAYLIGWFALSIYFLFLYNIGILKVRYLYYSVFFIWNICGFLNRSTFLREVGPVIEEIYELGNDIRECIPEAVYDGSGKMPDLWFSYAREEDIVGGRVELKYYLFPDFDLNYAYEIQGDYNREMKDIIAEFDFDYVVLYGVNEGFYDAYYWYFADGLSNAAEQYENGSCQAYRVIRDETTDEFRWFEPIL